MRSDQSAATLVRPPLVGESPVSMECKHHCTLTLPANNPDTVHHVVVGQVIGIHINDEFITDGKVDWLKIQPLARMGYSDYTYVNHVFTMKPPGGEIHRRPDWRAHQDGKTRASARGRRHLRIS